MSLCRVFTQTLKVTCTGTKITPKTLLLMELLSKADFSAMEGSHSQMEESMTDFSKTGNVVVKAL